MDRRNTEQLRIHSKSIPFHTRNIPEDQIHFQIDRFRTENILKKTINLKTFQEGTKHMKLSHLLTLMIQFHMKYTPMNLIYLNIFLNNKSQDQNELAI